MQSFFPISSLPPVSRDRSSEQCAHKCSKREERLPSEAGLEGERERGWCLKKIAFQIFPRRTYSVRINGRSTQRGAKQVSRHRARSGRRRCATSPTTTSLARTVGSGVAYIDIIKSKINSGADLKGMYSSMYQIYLILYQE